MTRRATLGLAFLVGGALCPSAAAAEEARKDFVVTVRVEAPAVTVHRGLGTAEIRLRSNNPKAVGFTYLPLSLSTEVTTTGVSGVSRLLSVWVSEVALTLRYRSVDIYVSSDFRKDACLYQALVEHEHEHIRQDRALVDAYVPRLEAAVRQAGLPTYEEPLEGVRQAEGRRRAQARLREVVQPLVDELLRRREEESQALDEQESFEVFRQRCHRR